MTIIEGRIIKGKGVGKTLGFPTINIPYNGKKNGVFAGKVLINGDKYNAAINLGARPTFNDGNVLCEAFLLDWDDGEIEPGTVIKVELFRKIRETKKFSNAQELQRQIFKDVEFVKSCYNL